MFTDVIVEVEGEHFHTHKFFLNAFSGFFQGLFNSGMKDCLEDKVVLRDTSKDVFRVILKLFLKVRFFLIYQISLTFGKQLICCKLCP